MQRALIVAMCYLLVSALNISASDTPNRISLEAGSWISRDVPLSMPYEGTTPDQQFIVQESKTGKAFPAAVHEGRLYFVPEGAMPNTTHHYTLKKSKQHITSAVQITKQDNKDVLDVHINGAHFTSYHYSNANRKPFLWPIYAEGNVEYCAHAWEQLLDAPKRAKALGERARERCGRDYRLEVAQAKLSQVFDELLGGTRTPVERASAPGERST